MKPINKKYFSEENHYKQACLAGRLVQSDTANNFNCNEMKMQKITIVAILFLFFCGTVYAQADWDVNPNQYVYSMTITGKVTINGMASVDESDAVGAFINGECRGVAKVTYQKILDEYFVFLMVYSNEPTGSVSFKIYDASAKKETNVSSELNFEVNDIVGSVSSPYNFSAQIKTYSANILTFKVANQVGSTKITSSTVELQVKEGVDRANLTPVFTLSESARAYVGGQEQVSGQDSHDFTTPVSYVIKPLEGAEKEYKVTITNEVNNDVSIVLSNATVYENEDAVLVGEISVSSNALGDNYTLSLPNISGTDNQYFYLSGNKLYTKSSFNYEVKASYKIKVRVDYTNVTEEKQFTIHVEDRNDPPKDIFLSTKTLSESTVVNKIVARIQVEDEDEGDKHQFTLHDGDGNSDNGNSYFSISGDSLVLVQNLNDFSLDSVSILLMATDNSGASTMQSWSFSLTDINSAPEINSVPVNYAIQNQVYVYPLQVSDNENDEINISFEQLPAWLTFNEFTMLLSGVPNNEDVGLAQFVITASDAGKETSQNVVISVLNVNDAPEINAYPSTQFFRAGRENSVALPKNCIVDPDDGDVLDFSLSAENNSTLPSWLKFEPATLTLSGSPAEDNVGLYALKLSAIDQGRLKEWVVFTLEVTMPTAIEDNFLADNFKVYPNPVESVLYLEIPNRKATEFSISNMQGQLVKKLIFNGGVQASVSVIDLVPGVYLAKCHQGNKVYIKQIVKQ
jgi:hypothetical protein